MTPPPPTPRSYLLKEKNKETRVIEFWYMDLISILILKYSNKQLWEEDIKDFLKDRAIELWLYFSKDIWDTDWNIYEWNYAWDLLQSNLERRRWECGLNKTGHELQTVEVGWYTLRVYTLPYFYKYENFSKQRKKL